MAITFSLVLLLGVVLVVMIRGGSVKWGPAIVAILFGFTLASTGAAEPLRTMLDSISDWIASVGDSLEQ